MNVARVFIAGVLVCAFAAVDVRAATKFKVQTLDDNCCEFSEGQVSALKGKGFTKVVCPFKIACVGTAGYPDAYLQECASLVASLIDVNRDGKVDSAKLQEKLTYHKTTDGPIVVGGTSQSQEDPGEMAGFSYTFSTQVWKGADGGALPSEPTASMKKILSEEVSHMFHQYGYALVDPDKFGMSDSTSSVACREAARLACANPGWHHPENKCPGTVGSEGNWQYPEGFTNYRVAGSDAVTMPLTGTCAEPNCDCAEFFHQASKMYLGITPGWFGAQMPQTKEAAAAMLSTEFKAAVDAAPYLKLTDAFEDGAYDGAAQCGSSATSAVADMTMMLVGYTEATFDATAKTAFKTGVSKTAGVEASAVKIIAVHDVDDHAGHDHKRRLLASHMAGEINIDFQVTAATTEAAVKLGNDLKAAGESGALVTALKSAGLDKTTSTKLTKLKTMSPTKARAEAEKIKKEVEAEKAKERAAEDKTTVTSPAGAPVSFVVAIFAALAMALLV